MKAILVLGVLLPALARAQGVPAEVVRPGPAAEELTAEAHEAARVGNCALIPSIGAQLRRIDPVYYEQAFALDPELSQCMAPGGVGVRSRAPFDIPATGTYKNPSTALAWSLGLTLGGYGLTVLGSSISNRDHGGGGSAIATVGSLAALVGPTAGHIYAGKTWSTGLGMRLLGVGAALTGLVVAFSSCPLFGDHCNNAGADVGVAVLLGGVGLYVVGTIYEIGTAPSAAREANAANHQDEPTVGIAPLVTPGGGGLAVAGRF